LAVRAGLLSLSPAWLGALSYPRVATGEPAGVEALKTALQGQRGILVKDLQVAGAFHSPMMASAAAPLAAALQAVPLNMPRVPVLSNVTGRPFTSVEEIRRGLVQQVTAPVKWQCCVEELLAHGSDEDPVRCYDLGPRDTLKAMLRKTKPSAWKYCISIDV
jgi:[acyl-carrier-protein] S-malonyltransferase